MCLICMCIIRIMLNIISIRCISVCRGRGRHSGSGIYVCITITIFIHSKVIFIICIHTTFTRITINRVLS